MDTAKQVDVKPPPDFQEVTVDPSIEFNVTDSSELWLIQWPQHLPPDFDGQEVSFKLHSDGHFGSLEGSSGKFYDVVSYASHDPDATVFLSSASEPKTAGKISRRVSLVHYPDPNELKRKDADHLKRIYGRSSASSLTGSANRFSTPKSSGSRSRLTPSTSGYSGLRSSFSRGRELPESTKRERVHKPTDSMDKSAQHLGRSDSVVTLSGSLGDTQEKKPKKKARAEG